MGSMRIMLPLLEMPNAHTHTNTVHTHTHKQYTHTHTHSHTHTHAHTRCGRHVKAKKNARVVTISSPKQLSREEFVSMSGGGHSATHSICSGYSDNGDHGQFGGPNSTFILGGGGGGYSKVDPLALNGLFPLPPPQYPKNVQVDYPPGVLCLDSPSPSSAARSTHSEPPVSSRPCAGGTGEGGRRRRMRRRRERSPRTSYSPSFSSAHRQSPGGGGGGGASRSVSACSGTAGKHVTASAAHSRGLNPEMSRFRDLELLGYPYAAKGGRQVRLTWMHTHVHAGRGGNKLGHWLQGYQHGHQDNNITDQMLVLLTC